ncbi:HDOD domain-containing protein [Pseudoxanthomonas composti]|uniref:HDOD domain-containing protein n=1 Tax=Pseudoxanthomonas composti TaxID=2137479 RepID=A0A4V1N1C4_9GAMM|nr:HDOD domain-containing protein [Pseudoxanthomonas composti]RXR07159.1 HDOD domain-containing protein [Pseudoxanthomonas composti]
MSMSVVAVVAAVGAFLLAAGWFLARRRQVSAPLPTAAIWGEPVSAPQPAAQRETRQAPARVDLQAYRIRLHALALQAPSLGEGQFQIQGAHLEVAGDVAVTLSDIASHPRYMPRRPQLLPQLMQKINDSGSSAQGIAALIAQDPALAGNLLRIANSPLYRLQSLPVENIQRAVAMLGTEGLRQIIAAALMQPVMSDKGAFGQFPTIIWEHTLLAANAAAEHAGKIEHGDGFAAQLLGLLQGLGAIIVVQVLRDAYARRPQLTPDPAVAASLLDTWAGPTAYRLASSWELSERMLYALDDLGPASTRQFNSLGRSLQFGTLAGTLATLSHHDQLQECEQDVHGLLASAGADAALAQGLWTRLSQREPKAGQSVTQ